MLLRLLLSAVVGWIIATGVYAAGLVLGVELAPRIVIGIAAVVTIVLAAAADRIAMLLARQVGKMVLDVDEFEALYEEPEYDSDPETSYLVGVFINNVLRRVVPRARVILQDNTGAPLYDPGIDQLDPMVANHPTSVQGMGRVKAIHYQDNIIGVVLDPEAYNALVQAIRRGGGEKVIVQDSQEIITIYEIIKKTYMARYPDTSEEIAAYVAYKTILALVREGIIDAPPHILDLLPYENHETRTKIIEQVREEGIL